MLETFLIIETAKVLRSAESWDVNQCEVSPDGRPHPSCGKSFVCIFENDNQNNTTKKTEGCISYEGEFVIRITKRVSANPLDRFGVTIYAEASNSLGRLATTVLKRVLEKGAQIRDDTHVAINAAVSGLHQFNNSKGFRWVSTDLNITPRPNEWFSSEQEEDPLTPAGFSLDLNFKTYSNLYFTWDAIT